jgi:hypothetical protein
MKPKKKKFSRKRAAKIIQRKFRAFVAMKAQRQLFLRMKAAAVTIQRRFRDYLIMKSIEVAETGIGKVGKISERMMKSRFMLKQFVDGLSNPEILTRVLMNQELKGIMIRVYSNRELMKYLDNEVNTSVLKQIIALVLRPMQIEQHPNTSTSDDFTPNSISYSEILSSPEAFAEFIDGFSLQELNLVLLEIKSNPNLNGKLMELLKTREIAAKLAEKITRSESEKLSETSSSSSSSSSTSSDSSSSDVIKPKKVSSGFFHTIFKILFFLMMICVLFKVLRFIFFF